MKESIMEKLGCRYCSYYSDCFAGKKFPCDKYFDLEKQSDFAKAEFKDEDIIF